MNDPPTELPHIFIDFFTVCPVKRPSVDETEIREFYTEDAQIKHPFFFIPSRAGSREQIVQVFRFFGGFVWRNDPVINNFSRQEDFIQIDELIALSFGYLPFIRTILAILRLLIGVLFAFIGKIFYNIGWV
ncbi:hypothetical protein G9A89_005007 [Geosiphon pyriformis]|nr:hypothetical protein G9A89_005007 [Geosiphon pyriformis]